MNLNAKKINALWGKTIEEKDATFLTKCTATKHFAMDDDLDKDKTVNAVIVDCFLSSYIAYYDNGTFKIERDTLWTWKKRNKKSEIDNIINKHTDNKWIKEVLKPIHKEEKELFNRLHKEAIKNVRKER